jgi:hypothetical protein
MEINNRISSEKLDNLKEKYKDYTKYGLIDEIRKVKNRFYVIEKAFDLACKWLGDNVPCGVPCPESNWDCHTSCAECFADYFIQKAKGEF